MWEISAEHLNTGVKLPSRRGFLHANFGFSQTIFFSPDCEKQPHTERRKENQKTFHFRLCATSPRVPCSRTIGAKNVLSQTGERRKKQLSNVKPGRLASCTGVLAVTHSPASLRTCITSTFIWVSTMMNSSWIVQFLWWNYAQRWCFTASSGS